MNYFKSYLGILGIMVILFACDTESETRNPETLASDSAVADTSQVTLSQKSTSLQNLVKSNAGVFRGVNLGMTIAEVKKLEDTTQIEEEAADHIDYMVTIKELETAEVRYIFEPNQKLSKIEINIYPNSKGSQDTLYKELTDYFNSKFGAGTTGENSQKWENKKSDIYIAMEKKDTQKVHDITIVINSLMRQSALIFEEPLPEGH